MNEITIALLGIAGAFGASILGSWLVFRAQMKRIPSQNARDDMDTAKIALEISEASTKRQLELEKKVESLEGILKTRYYKVTVVFSLGEIPKIESASVEALTDIRHHIVATK